MWEVGGQALKLSSATSATFPQVVHKDLDQECRSSNMGIPHHRWHFIGYATMLAPEIIFPSSLHGWLQ